MSAGRRVMDFIDERSGLRALLHVALDEPVPGGARFAYVFGSCLVFVLGVQVVTGIGLAAFYSPSTSAAWASVAYVQDSLPLGWFVRGLHSAGASAMIILLVLHLVQVTIWGAYKKPRELNYLFGLALVGLVFAFALTGYLLPWDQKGYFATQVATGLLGATPLVGGTLQALIQGGERYGNLTLTHFYALHTLLLPATVAALTAMHVALMRRHGVTPSWNQSEAELAKATRPFHPHQLLRDLLAMVVVLACMVYATVASHGAGLDAPADPSSSYEARPEWYFLPLFQLLKIFPGRLEVPAALGAPLLVFGILGALPFVDRGPSRDPRQRPFFVGAVLLIVVAAVGLGVVAKHEDARSPTFQTQHAAAETEAMRARKLAREGVPPSGGVAVYENDPMNQAKKLFAVRCAGCHRLDGKGDNFAPTLDGWSSRAYIASILRDPDSAEHFGKTKMRAMKAVDAPSDEIEALLEYILAQRGESSDEPLRVRGAAIFKERDCDECHEIDGKSASPGPNFGGWGGAEWLMDFVRDPSEARFYGKKNEMPKFGDKLSSTELDGLVKLLLSGRGANVGGHAASAP